MNTRKLARGLGWFSVGLGLAELLAPRAVARVFGLERRAGTVRAFGAREIASGVGILASRRRAPWLWSRVVGDVMDLALLGSRLGRSRKRPAVIGALANVLGITALDVVAARGARR